MHDKVLGTALPSVQALAYLGDSMHSLYVREMLVRRGLTKSGDLNREALKYVTARSQAEMYRKISHLLLDDERDVFRRASNSGHLNKPKRASVSDYRTATGFEAVIGMLYYIRDSERLMLLLDEAHRDEENDTKD